MAGREYVIGLMSRAGLETRIDPAAMISVPSVAGISHSPQEYTRPVDGANGARVLLSFLLLADQRP